MPASSKDEPIVDYCDCPWIGEDAVDALQDCGCRKDGHQVRLYRDVVVHWKGEHWRVECAFEDAVAELEAIRAG
jgi:hypothetical protein